MHCRLTRYLLIFVTFFSLFGCGTVRNMVQDFPDSRHEQLEPFGIVVEPGGKQIYGGTRSDLIGAFVIASPLKDPENLLEPAWLGAGVFLLADTPISFVADTLTLPWTIPASKRREVGSTQKSTSKAQDDQHE